MMQTFREGLGGCERDHVEPASPLLRDSDHPFKIGQQADVTFRRVPPLSTYYTPHARVGSALFVDIGCPAWGTTLVVSPYVGGWEKYPWPRSVFQA